MWLSTVVILALAAGDKPKLAMLDVQANGVDAAQADALGEAISKEVDQRGYYDVLTAKDLRTLLGVERQKQLLGCGDSSCTAELSGAIGARFVLQSTLTRLGTSMQLSVQMLDTSKAQTVARAVRVARNVLQLREALPYVVAEATATPMPEAPSKTLPWLLIAGGAAIFATGGIFAIDGFSRERAVKSALAPEAGVYPSYSYFVGELEVVTRNKTFGFLTMLGGAALGVVGVIIFPKDVQATATLVPTFNGVALVGGFP